MSTQTKKCDACGQTVSYTGHRGFGPAHKGKCPKEGLTAIDSDHDACPKHAVLNWVVGPYSSFRSCILTCTAGKRGKQHRYCAPRGEHAESTDDETTEGDETTKENTETMTETSTPTPKARKATIVADEAHVSLTGYGSLGTDIMSFVESRARTLASEMVSEALKEMKVGGPSIIEWRINSEAFAKIEGTSHKALPRLLKLFAAGFRNFLVVGPAGSGKTTLAANLATALSLMFASVSCTAGMSESALTGRSIPDLTTGKVVFQSTDFVRCYETSGVFLIDETDAADANVMLVINSALANGHMPLPNRTEQPSATRHASSVVVCAANTWGMGADRQYVGRNQLDAAFLDRFVGATIEVDYDRDLESALVGDANICARVWTIRDKVMELKLRRVVGTRFLLSTARLVKCAGESLDAALIACTTGWTTDERTKVGIKGTV